MPGQEVCNCKGSTMLLKTDEIQCFDNIYNKKRKCTCQYNIQL